MEDKKDLEKQVENIIKERGLIDLNDTQLKTLKLIEKSNLSDKELKLFLNQIKEGEPNRNNVYSHDYGSKKFKIGLISDTHIGHKNFNYKLFDKSIKVFDKEKVDAIYHAGDIIDGMSNREGHIFELEYIGVTNQVNHAVQLLSQYNQPIYAITGNHDGWASRKANQGVEVGEMLENRLKNFKHLGNMSADVILNKYIKFKLTHAGNNAYALSYAGQKQINALEGGTKPHLWANGHGHKSIYMCYRNIHYIESATFENQTDFMKMKGLAAMLGFYVLSGKASKKNGIQDLKVQYFPAYE